MRIAIAQMPMGWTPEENTRCLLEHLAQVRALGADLALFPECSVTGYHRRIPEQVSRELVLDALARIQRQCAALQLPAIVGTPYFPSSEPAPVWNAAVAIGADGQIRAICPKSGLTVSERLYFHAGASRPIFTLGTTACSVLLCREVRDAEQLAPQLRGARLLFWPGAITWHGGATHPDDMLTVETAREAARTLDSYLVQCNWPHSLNRPEATGMGGSLVVSPTGEILHQCALDSAGISVFTLEPMPQEVQPCR